MTQSNHSLSYISNRTAILLRLLSEGKCVQSGFMDLGHNYTILRKNLTALIEGGLVVKYIE